MFTTHRPRALAAVIVTIAAGLLGTTQSAGAAAPSPFGILANSTGTAYGNGTWTLLVGDSLTYNVGSQAFADYFKSSNGRSTFVAASAGSSLPNWVNQGWLDNPAWGGPNLASLANYVAFLKPRITILALGSNDARIMTSNPGQYTSTDHFWKLLDAINKAKAQSRCVVLTTVPNRWNLTSTASVNAVNANINWADNNVAGVYVADWAGYSAGHPDWFAAPGDIHHSAAGKLYYANYLGNVTKLLAASGQC